MFVWPKNRRTSAGVNKTGGAAFTQINNNFKTNTMTKQYKNKKALIISDSSKFPDDFWNYWVNPIVGYYIPNTQSKKYKPKDKTPQTL